MSDGGRRISSSSPARELSSSVRPSQKKGGGDEGGAQCEGPRFNLQSPKKKKRKRNEEMKAEEEKEDEEKEKNLQSHLFQKLPDSSFSLLPKMFFF